jgi:hypothetical protein
VHTGSLSYGPGNPSLQHVNQNHPNCPTPASICVVGNQGDYLQQARAVRSICHPPLLLLLLLLLALPFRY